jgi:pimeloyl-ACP methyl ester carboxylesterase
MKKITLFLLATIATLSLYAQDITGDWNGALSIQGQQLRLVIHVTRSGEGYTATMDSPDQGATGIPVTTLTFQNPVFRFEVANLRVEYTGELKDGIIAGTFKQGGFSMPMDLSRKAIEKKTVVRPQEPAKPYPYYAEEVTFENARDKITLAGTLTLPKKEGVFPVVVLISGSGPQNRDEELMGHKPFLVLADHLTRAGIAVLRFDDRGTAASKGNFSAATSADFASDVEAAVQYLQGRKEINQKKIGLVGHSEGGMIAPMVATKTNAVSFIVLLAGPGITGADIILTQQEKIGKASGTDSATLQTMKAFNRGMFDIITKSSNPDALQPQLTAYLQQKLKDMPQYVQSSGMAEEELVKTMAGQFTGTWMQYFLRHDPVPVLEKVKVPVLALNGEKDLQVLPKENLEAIRKALAKNKNATVKELPGLNHLFQEAQTGHPQEYAAIDQTFSPAALTEISNWILKQTK